jgi:hypothetical protein
MIPSRVTGLEFLIMSSSGEGRDPLLSYWAVARWISAVARMTML